MNLRELAAKVNTRLFEDGMKTRQMIFRPDDFDTDEDYQPLEEIIKLVVDELVGDVVMAALEHFAYPEQWVITDPDGVASLGVAPHTHIATFDRMDSNRFAPHLNPNDATYNQLQQT